MNKFKRKVWLGLILMVILFTTQGFAQVDPEAKTKKEQEITRLMEAEPVIITSSKMDSDIRETGASITVISGKEIEKKGKRTVYDVLRDVPGVHIDNTYKFGGISSIYIRGAGSGSSIVLIDGVRINDPSSPNKEVDMAHIMTDNIERIEVIRGAQSVLYGSDAIGGVVNIITKKGKRDPKIILWAEGGAYNTFREKIGVSGGSENSNYSFMVSRTDTDGFSSAVKGTSDLTHDDDGYSNTTFSSRIGIKTFHDSWFSLSIRFVDSKTDLDDGSRNDDPNYISDSKAFYGVADYKIPIYDWWESRLIFTYMSMNRSTSDPQDIEQTQEDSDSLYKGVGLKAEWRNKFTIAEINEILIGGEIEREEATSYYNYYDYTFTNSYQPSDFKKRYNLAAVYIQDRLNLFDRLFLTAGLRWTHTDNYGDEFTYLFSGSFILPFTETRLKANVGTGFKIPSLYQRYDPTLGNTSLEPERTISYDVGFEQSLFDEVIILETNFFSTKYERYIFFDRNAWAYRMIDGGVIIRGVECILRLQPFDDLTISGIYTYTYTRNHEEKEELERRPKHNATLNLDYNFFDRGNINISYVFYGRRVSGWNWTNMNWDYNHPYHQLNATLSFWVIEDHLQLFARGENLLNYNYQEVLGYQTAGISFYGGLKAVY